MIGGTSYVNFQKGAAFAKARGDPTDDELLFIAGHHYRGTSPANIARMLNRSIATVEAVTARLSLPLRCAPVSAPAPASRQGPYVSPSIRLKLVPLVDTMASIAQRIADDHGLTLEDLRGQSRKKIIAQPRQAAFHACYAVRTDHGTHRYSLPLIGRYFGGRDHTTVLWGVRQHKKRLAQAGAA